MLFFFVLLTWYSKKVHVLHYLTCWVSLCGLSLNIIDFFIGYEEFTFMKDILGRLSCKQSDTTSIFLLFLPKNLGGKKLFALFCKSVQTQFEWSSNCLCPTMKYFYCTLIEVVSSVVYCYWKLDPSYFKFDYCFT